MSQQNDYQFVMIPQKLASCLDANCHKMLTVLIGLNSILSNEDGWFYRSNKDLQLDTRFSQNLVIATLDTLYQAGIVNIDSIGKGRGHRTNRIHINFESFKKYEHYSFNDIRNNPELWIETVNYKNHYSPSYCKEIGKKVTTNTDTTDTLNTLDTKEYNIINKEEEKKPCTKEELNEIYLNNFGDLLSIYPSLNYNLLLLNDLNDFYECYIDIVNELKMKIAQASQRNITETDILKSLQLYLEYTGYSYQ